MKNITMHQANAIAIQMISDRSIGCFHQMRSDGGRIDDIVVPSLRARYFASGVIGTVTISITPQTM